MAFTLHEKAVEALNQRAEELLLKLTVRPVVPEPPRKKVENSLRHLHMITLTEKDISNLNVISGSVDGLGRRKSYEFFLNSEWVGLYGEDYLLFWKEVERLTARPEFREIATEECIEKLWFQWFQERYKIKDGDPFYPFFANALAQEIVPLKIAIPIEHFAIQSPFNIGRIRFEYLKKEDLDQFSAFLAPQIDNGTTLENIVTDMRKRYQGKVLATITVTAEREKGIEIAYRETEVSLSVLRLFSHSVYYPEVVCLTEVRGKVLTPMKDLLILKLPVIEAIRRTDIETETRWDIPDFLLDEYRKMGLPLFETLILKIEADRTDLEKKLISCLSLFSRSVCSAAFHDKVVYMLVTLESLLLANQSEPIQSSIGPRLAYLVTKDISERKKVIAVVKECYDIRSRYLHHGKTDSEGLDKLRDLQTYIQTALRNVVVNIEKITSKSQLIDHLTTRMLSG